ncbi:Cysteine protease [Giardia lamblia P15]|uniref:Cysteine protease n=1 Tax=Giardia intestinalis (strain P15) TaxID=658858 RepID=E1F2D1_GIAIA|nr:Cysteine protease [Giardia lamblia P15]
MLLLTFCLLCAASAERDPFSIHLACEDAFRRFVGIYGKTYDTPGDRLEAERNFCVHLEHLRRLRREGHEHVTFGITSRMDHHPRAGLLPPRSLGGGEWGAGAGTCTRDSKSNKYTNCNVDAYELGPDLKGESNPSSQNANDKNKKQDSFFLVDVRDMNVNGRQRTLPHSVDLREVGLVTRAKDQGLCGSCYEFTTIEVLENLMLVDADLYTRGKYLDPKPFPSNYFCNCSTSAGQDDSKKSADCTTMITVQNRTEQDYTDIPENWKSYSASTLRLSVQFLLDNLIGGNYCNGGNYFRAISDFVNKLSKLAKESECIYREYATPEKAAPDSGAKCQGTNIGDFNPAFVSMPMKKKSGSPSAGTAGSDEYEYDVNGGSGTPKKFGVYQILRNEGVPASGLIAEEMDKGKFAAWERNVMNVLARGVGVAAAMHTESGVDTSIDKDYGSVVASALTFNLYKSGVFPDVKCVRSATNHQVMLVGYGAYKGRPVWILRNSWGTGWGVSGYYYIGRGSNSLCHELSVEYTMPRFYGPDRDGVHPLFLSVPDEAQKVALADAVRASPFSNKVKRCVNGLDTVDAYGGTMCEAIEVSAWNYVLVGALAIVLFFLGRYCMQYYFCAPEYIFHSPINLNLPHKGV